MTAFFEDHLNMDAVVAFADGELSMTAYQRAAAHVMRCPDCASEIAEQCDARDQLRSAGSPQMRRSLAQALFSIPVALRSTADPSQLEAITAPGVGRELSTNPAIRVEHVTLGKTRKARFRLGDSNSATSAAETVFTLSPKMPFDRDRDLPT
ncbi:zf-HC2 domain-containing protein [Nakamurella antarctica]|uniref:Zf-HC2 domain-containing protein n=1 Tax=Nakamurella antarctica TaxID=1902245 RepID=A0A3G8ZVT4_9ACTN|nr:zf-HC2 domain-containing protein [Nakamurella antarctica]AZI58126.1 zf-HC2 domain-containing protein [Nakamurella antarctica]